MAVTNANQRLPMFAASNILSAIVGASSGVALVMRLWAHRDETDDEMNARIEREEYDAERGMKNARAREQQRRADDLHVLKLITERLGRDTVLKALEA
jgi:hypothetical protein